MSSSIRKRPQLHIHLKSTYILEDAVAGIVAIPLGAIDKVESHEVNLNIGASLIAGFAIAFIFSLLTLAFAHHIFTETAGATMSD